MIDSYSVLLNSSSPVWSGATSASNLMYQIDRLNGDSHWARKARQLKPPVAMDHVLRMQLRIKLGKLVRVGVMQIRALQDIQQW